MRFLARRRVISRTIEIDQAGIKDKQYRQVAKKLIAKNSGKFLTNSEGEVLHGTSLFK
jgi:hypothetical protein